MTKKLLSIEPIDIIAALRIGIKKSEYRFKNGGCFQLYRVLKQIFPQAEAWYDGEHVYTKIDSEFYDIDGVAKWQDKFCLLSTEKMIYAQAHDWDFEKE